MNKAMVTPEQMIEMFIAQETLNEKFNGKNWREQVTLGKARFALLDEVSEMARELENEWKWWSSNPRADKQKAIVEFIDILHFAMLVVLRQHEIDKVVYQIKCYRPEPGNNFRSFESEDKLTSFVMAVTRHLQSLYLDEFYQTRLSSDNLSGMIQTTCDLMQAGGELLNLDPDEIYQTYLKKNELNHKRVDGGILEGRYDKSKEEL